MLLRLLGDTLGVRLVGPVAGLIVLAAYLLFRTYDVPDEVRKRVEPGAVAASEASGSIAPFTG